MSDCKKCRACKAVLVIMAIVAIVGVWYLGEQGIKWFLDMQMDAAKWRGHEQAVKEREAHDEIEAEQIRKERLKRESLGL